MAYPPTPDHVWDITTPADTQPANQGGADFRNLKDDIMQRLALLSGVIANQPTPETVNATWGGSGYGLIFFATDTKQLFQWTGSAWSDISGSLPNSALFTSSGVTLAPADTTLDTIYSYTVLANTLGATGGFVLEFYVSLNVTVGQSITVSVNFGSVNVGIITATVVGTYYVRIVFLNSSASANVVTYMLMQSGGASFVGFANVNINTAMNKTIAVLAQKTRAADVASFANGLITRL